MTLTTTIYGDRVGVRANWANASDQVDQVGDDGEWVATGFQVADFRHSAGKALRHFIEERLAYGGEVNERDVEREVDLAIARAK